MLPKSTPEPIKNRAQNKVYKKTQKLKTQPKRTPKLEPNRGGTSPKNHYFSHLGAMGLQMDARTSKRTPRGAQSHQNGISKSPK